MGGIKDAIVGLFSPSKSIKSVPLYSLREKIGYWSNSRNYSSYFELPAALSFSPEFWTRVKEIFRHTSGDKHERAITVWWADGEFVLTESIRGQEQRVNIPKQKISVKYNPIRGTTRADRIVTVNGKVYAKRTVELATLKNVKKLEVKYLFNMHTHPPHDHEGGPIYSFSSGTDIKSFLSSSAGMTGLVTDHLWILAKTSNTPTSYKPDESVQLTPEYLTEQLNIKVYKAQFGGSAVVVRPEMD